MSPVRVKMINQDNIISEDNESEEVISAELPVSTEATAAMSPGVVERKATLKALKALKVGVGKGSAGADSKIRKPRISRELRGLTRADPMSPFEFTLGGASMTAVVGSRADQAGGSRSTRQSSAQDRRSHSAEGRRGGRSLSAEARSRGGGVRRNTTSHQRKNGE